MMIDETVQICSTNKNGKVKSGAAEQLQKFTPGSASGILYVFDPWLNRGGKCISVRCTKPEHTKKLLEHHRTPVAF